MLRVLYPPPLIRYDKIMTTELLLDRYEIIETTGRGGSSEIVKAFDSRMERIVAIKTIPANKKTALRAFREARTVALLNHPNIVTLYEFDETEDNYYLIMEYIDGLTLEDYLEDKGPIDPELAIAITIQVCVALENAHSNDVIHRDIKPANLMLLPDGRVKVMDFGVSRLKGTPVTRDGEITGTFSYMSPEQAKSELVDERSDVWSLGVVLYEMLTGINPFDAETPAAAVMKIVSNEPKSIDNINPDINSKISKIALKAISKYPEDRFDLATDFRYKLERHRRSSKSPKSILKAEMANVVPLENIDPNLRPVSYFKERLSSWIDSYGQVLGRVTLFGALSTFITWIAATQNISSGTMLFLFWMTIFFLGAIFPRAGLAAFLASLTLVSATISIALSIILALALGAYWLFFSRVNIFAGAIVFTAPLFTLVGIPFAFPLGIGLISTARMALPLAAFGYIANLFFEVTFNYDRNPVFSIANDNIFAQVLGPFVIWQLSAWIITALLGSFVASALKKSSRYLALIISTTVLSLSYSYAPKYLQIMDTDSLSIIQPMTFSFIIVMFMLILFDHSDNIGNLATRTKNNRQDKEEIKGAE